MNIKPYICMRLHKLKLIYTNYSYINQFISKIELTDCYIKLNSTYPDIDFYTIINELTIDNICDLFINGYLEIEYTKNIIEHHVSSDISIIAKTLIDTKYNEYTYSINLYLTINNE